MIAKRVERRWFGILTVPLVLLAVLTGLLAARTMPPRAGGTTAPLYADSPGEDPDFG